jgi:hemerythrin-like domain-containing protein
MLRDASLIPLSHQHQHALTLCVRLERARNSEPAEIMKWNEEISRTYETEIRFHFEAEETVLFPAAGRFPELRPLVEELFAEHGVLRSFFARAQQRALAVANLKEFASTLSAHVRKEERELFEGCQAAMSGEELQALGSALDQYFKTSGMPGRACEFRPQP